MIDFFNKRSVTQHEKMYHNCIYYLVDNLCKIYEEWIEHRLLSTNQQRHRIGKLTGVSHLANNMLI